MARRQQPAAQTEYAVLEERIAQLEAQMRIVNSSQRSTILTSDSSKHLDPVQGEVIVSHPGSHPEASPGDGFVYYHDGKWRRLVGNNPWIAVYDNYYWGQPIDSTMGEVDLEFPYIDWSDGALGTVFTYAVDDSGGTLTSPNIYQPAILASGVYAITLNIASVNVNSMNYGMRVHLYADKFPGYRPNDPITGILNDADYRDYTGYSQGYLFYTRTWVVPIQVTSPPIPIQPSITMVRQAAEPDVEITTMNRMWITCLGGLDHEATLLENNDPGPIT